MLAVVIVLEVVPLDVSDKVNAGRNNASSTQFTIVDMSWLFIYFNAFSVNVQTYIYLALAT